MTGGLENQAQEVDAGSVLAWGEAGGGFPVSGHRETLPGDGNILYLDCDGGYLGCIFLLELTKL